MGAECSSRIPTRDQSMSFKPLCTGGNTARGKQGAPAKQNRKSKIEVRNSYFEPRGVETKISKDKLFGKPARGSKYEVLFSIFEFRFSSFTFRVPARSQNQVFISWPWGRAGFGPAQGGLSGPAQSPPSPGGGWMDRLTVNRVPCQSARKVSWLTAG